MTKPAVKYLEGVEKPHEVKIYKNFESEVKFSDDNKRVLVVRISTVNPDRSKDTVQPSGMVYENFLKNPVVLFAHKYDTKPIAKCTSLRVSKDVVEATVEFLPEGVYQEADIIYEMYKGGFLNAWSIGFMALDYEDNDFGGYNFKQWELFEFSSVPVPDNPEALTIIRSKGLNVEDFIEKKDAPVEEAKPEVPAEQVKEVEQTLTLEDVVKAAEAMENDTKVSELTVAQLKALIIPAEQAVQKDVSQVTSLAYVLSDLQWIAYMFEYDEVSQSTIDKLNQAISLILEAIKEQAELGKKEVAITQEAFDKLTPEQQETVKGILTKAGRTISAKNEEKLRTATDHLKQGMGAIDEVLSVLDSEGDEPADEGEKITEPEEKKEAPPQNDFLVKLANSVKTSNQKQDATLRLLKQLRGGKGGDK
jgi:uncharacterized protein